MHISVSHGSRLFLDNHPLIEDLLTYIVFESNYSDTWISDESNLYHMSCEHKISEALYKVFTIEISPDEILKEYATIMWLEKNFKISQISIQQEILELLNSKMTI